jgi:hypothetical protein
MICSKSYSEIEVTSKEQFRRCGVSRLPGENECIRSIILTPSSAGEHLIAAPLYEAKLRGPNAANHPCDFP